MRAIFVLAVLSLGCGVSAGSRDEPDPEKTSPPLGGLVHAVEQLVEPAQEIDAAVEGRAVRVTHAYAVAHGGESFRVHLAARPRGCDWAIGGGLGEIRPDDVHLTVDVAPVTDSTGTRWRAVGGSWNTGRDVGSALGNLGFDRFDAEVTRDGDALRVAPEIRHDGMTIVAPFVATICNPEAASPPAPDAPMTVTLGETRFPLTRAWIEATPGGGHSVRISRNLAPCTSVVTHEDVFVSFGGSSGVEAPSSLRVQGQATAELFTFLREAPLTVRREGAPPDERLRVETDRVMYEDWMRREGPVRVRIEGAVPLTRCP